MHDSLQNARDTVEGLIASSELPARLIGDITISDLTLLVESVASDAIKAQLSDKPTSDETIQEVIEYVALVVGLVMTQATMVERVESGDTENADISVSLNADEITDLMANLLRGNGATIRLTVN